MSSPAKVLSPQFDRIPQELRVLDRWLLWRAKPRTGKLGFDKIPHSVHTKHPCNAHDPAALGTFDQVKAAYERGGFGGIGLMPGEGVGGVDLDKCVDPQTGEIAPWAAADIKALDSYTEVSPSGTGIRLFVKGKQPAGKKKAGMREIYSGDGGNFLTVTGHALAGSKVEERQDALEDFHAKHFGETSPTVTQAMPAGESRLNDEQVLHLARNDEKFQRLYGDGDLSDYGGDHSAADLALATKLAFYCGRDPEQMERLFKESILGQRDKWLTRQDYRERTLAKALEMATQVHPAQCGPENMFPTDLTSPDEPGQEKSAARPLFISARDLRANLKPPVYLIEDLVERDTTGVVFGPYGTFKSFMQFDKAAAVASGQDFAGRAVVEPGAVFYLAGEGHGGLTRRLEACCQKRGILKDQLLPLFVSSYGLKLDGKASIKAIVDAARGLAEKIGEPRLVVVDTLATAFSGDENSSADMLRFIDAVNMLRLELGGPAIEVVHHTGLGDKTRSRGSSALEAGLDSVFRISRDGMRCCLHQAIKMKDGDPQADIWFKVEPVVIGMTEDMNPITSLALTYDPNHKPQVKAVPLSEARKTILAAFDPEGSTLDEAAATLRKAQGFAFNKSNFNKMVSKMTDDGILIERDGKLYS